MKIYRFINTIINRVVTFFFLHVSVLLCDTKSKKFFNNYKIFYKLLSYTNYEEIYTPKFDSSYIKYVILTISNPCNFRNRCIQRKHRINYLKNMLFIYVIGDNKCRKEIYYESKTYEDVLLLRCKNHYFNITLLFLSSLLWVKNNICYDYLIKWDDDIIVNIPLLNIFINLIKIKKNDFYYGYIYNNTKICRDKNKLCYIPFLAYKYISLPSFAASGLLLLSKNTSKRIDLFHKLYKSYTIRDDQYLGVLCNILSIKPNQINKYYDRNNKNNYRNRRSNFLAYHSD